MIIDNGTDSVSITRWSRLSALYPKQWVKNVLVFAAPAAAAQLGTGTAVELTFTFVMMTCAAIGTYFINDVCDVEEDRLHPIKRHRPVASGSVSTRTAAVVGVLLMTCAIVGAAVVVNQRTACVIGVYVIVMTLYNLALRRIAFLDLAIVSSGFMLRAYAGATAVSIPVSVTFIGVVGCGALLLVAGKRLAELSAFGADGVGGRRPTLERYSPTTLWTIVTAATVGTALCYLTWVSTSHLNHATVQVVSFLIVSVVLGRYLMLLRSGEGEAPEDLLYRDRVIQVSAIAWGILFAVAVYG